MRATDLQALAIATVSVNSAFDTIVSDVSAALNTLGVSSRTLHQTPGQPGIGLAQALIGHMRSDGMPSFILSCNAKDRFVLRQEQGRDITIHEAWAMPMVALMLDHPALHLENLLRAPQNTIITVIDEGHLVFLNHAGLNARTQIFCPHGGPEPIPHPRPSRERPIDLLFSGHILSPAPIPLWLDTASGGQSCVRGGLEEAFDAVRSEGQEIYTALVAAFQRRGLVATPMALAKHVIALDSYAMQLRRHEILRNITCRRVVILGEIGDSRGLDHHDLRGPTSFAKTRSLMANAKILINSRWTFGRGGHERIFYGMSRGAVIATEQSTFLSEDLSQEIGMFALPHDLTTVNDRLNERLNDPEHLDEIRARGFTGYRQRHSWQERMSRLLPYLYDYYDAARSPC